MTANPHIFLQTAYQQVFTNQGQELRLSLFRPPTFSKDATLNVNLRTQDAVNEGLY